MKGLKTLLVVLALFAFNLHNAQEQATTTEELSLDKGNIKSQFEYIYKKSGNYRADGKRYEVVRIIS
ncbi:MAG: tRNA (guanine-N1)-methyltransferase, partial [Maribacter sp.]